MKKIYTLLTAIVLLFLFPVINTQAQIKDWCGTTPYFQSIIKENPKLKKQIKKNEKLIAKKTKLNIALTSDTIFIPVIVHVVWNTAVQNISDAQILSQINVLNEDYQKMQGTRGYNNSPIGADARIAFRLAQVDKYNQPTSGIEHIQTAVIEFTDTGADKDNVKFKSKGGADAWDSRKYLNMWVCNLIPNLLGYATFPGGVANIDGVVMAYESFGDSVGTSITLPYCLGRTTTHEVGHWLNLFHTFEGGCPNTNCLNEGDFVCDTPPEDVETSGCPLNRVACGAPVLTNDYMDYTNDICMNILTDGQNYRVRATLDYIRNTFKTSPGLSNHNFNLFGTHTGKYNYIANTNFAIKGASVYAPFIIPAASTVQITATGKHKITFDKNTKVMNGATFIVRVM